MNLPRRTTNVDMMRNQNNVSDVNHINVNNRQVDRQRNSKNDYLAIEEVQNPATSLGSDLFMSLDDEQILEIIEKEEQIQQQPQQVKEIDNIHNDDESSSIETYTAKNLQVFESDDNMTENPKSNRKDSINDNILSFSSNNERSSGTGQQNSQTFQSQYETDDDIDLPSAPDFSMDDLPIFTNHPIQKNAIRQEKVKATVKGSKADENEDSAPYAFVVDEVDLNEIFSLSDENSQGKEPTYQQPGHPDALNKLEQENSLMENNAEFPEQTVSRMSPSLKNNSTITADNVDSDMHNIADNEIIAEVDPNNRKGEDSFTTELNLLSLSDDKPGEVASNALNTVDNNAFSTIAPAMLTPSTSTSTTSSSSSGNLKRISLRQRNEIQLRPYSYDYAKYKELISRTRLTPTKKKARRKQDGELGNDDDVADGSFGSISQLSVGLESDNDDELFASQYIPPEDNTNTATFEEEDISDEPDTLSFREEEESTTKYGLDTLIVPSALFKNRRKEKHKSHDRKGKGKEAMAHDLSNVERGSSMHRRQQITTAGFKRSGSFAVKKKKKNRITTTFTDKPSTKRWIGTAPEQPLTKDIFSFDLFNSSSTQSPTTGEVIPSSSFVSRGSQHKQSSHPNPSNLNDSTSLHTIEDSEEEKETFDTQLPLPTPRFRKRRYLELESSDEEDDETDKNDNNGNSTIWDYPAAGFGSDNDTNTINISDEEDDTFAVNSYQSQLSNPRLSTSVDYHHFKRLLSDSVSKTPKMNLKRRANEDDDFIEDDDFYNNSRDGRRKRPKKVTDKALRHVLPKSFYRLYKDDIEQESNQRRQNKNALSGRKQQLTISTTNTASSSTTDSSPKMRTGTAPKTYQSEIIGSQERNMENFAAFLGSQRDDESEEDEQLQDGANTRLDDVPDSYIDDNDLDMNYYGHPQTSAAAANRIERRRQTVLPPRTITLRINEYYHPDGQQPPRRQRAEQRSTLEKYLQQFEAERQQAITESVERDASFNRDLQRQETASTSRVTERIASTSDDGRLGISRGINGKDGNVNLRGSKNTILPVRTAVNTNVSSGIPTKKTISAGNSISQANHQHKKRKKPKRRTRDDIYIHKPQCVRYDRSGQAPAGVDYYNKRNLQQRPLPSTIPPIYPKKTSTDDIYLGTLHEHHNYNWKPLEMVKLFSLQTLENVSKRVIHTYLNQNAMSQLPYKLNNNCVYLSEGIHLPLFSSIQRHHTHPTSTAAFFKKYKSAYTGTFHLFNQQVMWVNIIPQEQKLIDGLFFQVSNGVTQLFRSPIYTDQNDMEIDAGTIITEQSPLIRMENEYDHFYRFVSICLSLVIPHHSSFDARKELAHIFMVHIRGLAWQIQHLVDKEQPKLKELQRNSHSSVAVEENGQENHDHSSLVWLRPIIKLMLYILDWTCRLQQLGVHRPAEWSVIQVTQILMDILIAVGDDSYGLKKSFITLPQQHPPNAEQQSAKTAQKDYFIEAWIFILYLVSISTSTPELGYHLEGPVFVEQITQSILRKSKQSRTYEVAKRKTKREWAETLNLIIDKYMM